jgi:LAS superfamily LD-carboxypeptidase LdcB
MKRFVMLVSALALLAACGGSVPSPKQVSAPETRQPPATVSIVRATPTPPPTPRPAQLCLVTKQREIPATYVPPDLVTLPKEWSAQTVQMRREAADALVRLLSAARDDGIQIVALSGYRSYQEQVQVLAEEIAAYGPEQAHRQVADPGHSEHQLGLAVDVATARAPFDLEEEFGETPEGKWVLANATRFGFVVSYPQGKEPITGYTYEPWHIRYVGLPLARQIAASGQTLTEYLPAHHMEGCPPGA